MGELAIKNILVAIPAKAGIQSLLNAIKILMLCGALIAMSANYSFSQDTNTTIADTIRNVVRAKDDTASYKAFKFILSDHKYLYMNPSNPDTVTRKRFLWYNTKVTEGIFNYLPGYYLNYMDVGQLNPVSYNQIDAELTGVLRNGRPINDKMDGTIDFNLFSRNELDEIEVTGGLRNSLYGYFNTVNILQRQLFVNRAYTEISFFQDRYENLYFDGNFHQNLLRNLNFNFGLTKHSYDGKYTNSDFDKWLGRFNLNFAASEKLNFFAYVNYANIKKGINEGINSDSVNISDKEIIFDPVEAEVRNSDSYEKKERFDVDAGAVLLAGKSSFTKLQFFVSNSFREYRDEENRVNPNGKFIQDNYHWINYGAKLQQIFNFRVSKRLEIVSRSELELDHTRKNYNKAGNFITLITGNSPSYSTLYYLLQDITVKDNNFFLTAYLQTGGRSFSSVSINSGLRGGFEHYLDSAQKITASAFINANGKSHGGGLKYISPALSISSDYYRFKYSNVDGMEYLSSLNNSLSFRLWKLDFTGLYTFNITRNEVYKIAPKHFGNLELSFHDMGFKNKLEYKIGFSSRMWTEYKSGIFDGRNQFFSESESGVLTLYNIPANATLDFFIMAKIGRATFGLTVENILDRVIYNTGVYPYMDRGGFVNAISRFNITWNFTD